MPASPAQLPSATLRDRSLAVAAHCRQRRTHRHFLPWLNDERLDDAAFENFDFDDALLGFYQRHDVAALDRIARLHAPLDDGAVLHVGTERRHAKFTHGLTIPLYIEYATAGYGRIQCT